MRKLEIHWMPETEVFRVVKMSDESESAEEMEVVEVEECASEKLMFSYFKKSVPWLMEGS